jgi:hypothetical protein
MRRREFIAGLGGVAAWPVVARAQQAAMPVIGFLNSGSPSGYVPYAAGFRQGLKDSSFVEARTWRSNTAGRRTNPIGCRRRSRPVDFCIWQRVLSLCQRCRGSHGRRHIRRVRSPWSCRLLLAVPRMLSRESLPSG